MIGPVIMIIIKWLPTSPFLNELLLSNRPDAVELPLFVQKANQPNQTSPTPSLLFQRPSLSLEEENLGLYQKSEEHLTDM